MYRHAGDYTIPPEKRPSAWIKTYSGPEMALELPLGETHEALLGARGKQMGGWDESALALFR